MKAIRIELTGKQLDTIEKMQSEGVKFEISFIGNDEGSNVFVIKNTFETEKFV